MDVTRDELAALIDQTNLYTDATTDDIEQLCSKADTYGFPAVCIYPADIPTAKQYRTEHGGTYDICTVIGGFPHGRIPADQKAEQAQDAVDAGADEVDMVINRGHIRDGHYDDAVEDVQAVRDAVPDTTLKVILENCDLTDDEIVDAAKAAIDGGADFLKTSTGFGEHGARPKDVSLMADTIHEYADRRVGIKAAGGIKTGADAVGMLAASGLDADPAYFRIGASAGDDIVESLEAE